MMTNPTKNKKVNISDKYLRELLRKVVSLRAGGQCEYPGCSNTDCDPHHWRSKKNNAVKYDYNSCINLCCEHHTDSLLSAHKSPACFQSVIINSGARSNEWADKVALQSRQTVKLTESFLVQCKESLLREIERLK